MEEPIHERIAACLGWSVEEARSVPLPALRELVRPRNRRLAGAIEVLIQSGVYVTHPETENRK